MTPDAHIKTKKNLPMMQTTDLSLKLDPSYGPISKHFHKNRDEFAEAIGADAYCMDAGSAVETMKKLVAAKN